MIDESAHKVFDYAMENWHGFRAYKCSRCGRQLDIYYCESRLYLVRCKHCKIVVLVEAGSPNEAAEKVSHRAEPESKALTAQWISAKDKLPEIGQRVVVKCNELYYEMFDVLCYYPDYNPWKNDGVAYWLPLPELPENTRKPEGSERP
jgi:DNA-directed RNA polymerase subunit RPC12/RpoP